MRRNWQEFPLSEYIKEANKIHQGRYDYSKVNYEKAHDKIEIICPRHGSFWQTAIIHLGGTGCPKCFNKRRGASQKLDTTEFIKRARETHGDKYDYSQVDYVNSQTKIKIICPKHGEFWQRPASHIYGIECFRCGKKKAGRTLLGQKTGKSPTNKLITDEFIKRAKKFHGNKFDYSKTKYIDMHSELEIICPIHGSFWQEAQTHLTHDCPKCANENNGKRRLLSTEEFIRKAKEVHGDKYDYSRVDYQGKDKKVNIICHKHGVFRQNAGNHIHARQNCPLCASSKGEQRIADLLSGWRISYQHQKRFRACKDKQMLPFDFYFRIGKYQFLIEYDGALHFEAVKYFGGEKRFLEAQRRDKIKTNFAKEHDFVFIRIPYTQFDEIESILLKTIEETTGKPIAKISQQFQTRQTRKGIDPKSARQLSFSRML